MLEQLQFLMGQELVSVEAASGLTALWETIKNNWLSPLYLAAVAVFAIMFIKDRAWMKLIGFVGIAAVVGVMIFAGGTLFGENGSGGTLTNTAEDLAKKVN